jgi:dihydropteroate synthase
VYANLDGIDVGDGFPVRVVGALNVSPESFYRGSVATGQRQLQQLAVRMVDEGADLLDIGAMSTAPYLSGAIDPAEETRRMIAAVRAVRQVVRIPISADTQRSAVAAAALDAGATVINDVSGLRHDPAMGAVARAARGVILMAQQRRPSVARPSAMIRTLLRECVARARAADIATERVVLDPGIGFFRRAAIPWHQLDCRVLRELPHLRKLGRPLLVGISRKSFVGKLTEHADPADRLYGSLGAAAIAVYNGAALIRTHDVAATIDAIRVAEAIAAATTNQEPETGDR